MLRWRNKTREHDTDHGIGVSTQRNRLTHGVWIAAKEVLPERIAGHGEARPAFYIFNGRNDPAQHRLHAQRFEKPRIAESGAGLHERGSPSVAHLLHGTSATFRHGPRLS